MRLRVDDMERLEFRPEKFGPIPGPRSQALLERRIKLIPRGIYSSEFVPRQNHDGLGADQQNQDV